MIDLQVYPHTASNKFRWDAVPEDAKMEEHVIHARWMDLVWWCAYRKLWVYVATRINPNYVKEVST